jgi:hypothetical protein
MIAFLNFNHDEIREQPLFPLRLIPHCVVGVAAEESRLSFGSDWTLEECLVLKFQNGRDSLMTTTIAERPCVVLRNGLFSGDEEDG